MTAAILDIRASALRIPFKVTFRHASAERRETSSVIVTVRTANAIGVGESCPRPYVTGEQVETAVAFCQRHTPAIITSVTDVPSLRRWMTLHHDDIDRQPAAWCALELALLDAFGKEAGQTVEALLGLPRLATTFRYSAVLGDDEPAAFAAMAARYRAYGFTDYKIKLSGNVDRDRAKLHSFADWEGVPPRLRADANNLWTDGRDAIDFLRALEAPFWAIEEPLATCQVDALAPIAQSLGCRIILDESVSRVAQLNALSAPAARWVVNVRVSKMGGLLRALAVVETAVTAGHHIIVGAQVGETSLLTRAALPVAQAAGSCLEAQEGAFGTQLLQHDIVGDPLMFGQGGMLDLRGSAVAAAPGFGLETLPDLIADP